MTLLESVFIMYIIRDRETGTEIEEAKTYSEAFQIVMQYESEDKKNGDYTEDFYEIITMWKRGDQQWNTVNS